MPGSTDSKRTGAKPAPRLRITPPFLKAIRQSGQTMHQLSAASGFTHPAIFSPLLHNDFAGTPLIVERFERLARIIGFPTTELFIPGEPGVFDRDERSWPKAR